MTLPPSVQAAEFQAILKKPQNCFCADCDNRTPRWASTTFGTFVCIRCSGFHRKLGTHITKVKSVNLDGWTANQISLYKYMDNEMANEYWEYKLPAGFQRPTENSPPEVSWKFIQDKYVRKAFAPKNATDPATEYREGSVNEKPATPPTDDDSVKQAKKSKKGKKHKQEEVVVAEKVDINDILDLDIGNQGAPALAVEKPKAEDLWDLLDNNTKAKSAPAPQAQPSYVRAPQPSTYFYSNPQPNRYAALEQLSRPYAPQYNSSAGWCGVGLTPNPVYTFTNPVAMKQPVEKKAEKGKVDQAFADILPSDFL